MKVKCIALCNPEGKPVEFSPWLTVGGIYHVLGMLTYKNGERRFQIVTSEREHGVDSLGYFSDSCFEVVSNYRPSCWRDRVIGEAIETSPAAWQADAFLVELYEGDPEAIRVFERERNTILAEEP